MHSQSYNGPSETDCRVPAPYPLGFRRCVMLERSRPPPPPKGPSGTQADTYLRRDEAASSHAAVGMPRARDAMVRAQAHQRGAESPPH